MTTKGERREQKRRSTRKMRVSGRSVLTLVRVQSDRADRILKSKTT